MELKNQVKEGGEIGDRRKKIVEGGKIKVAAQPSEIASAGGARQRGCTGERRDDMVLRIHNKKIDHSLRIFKMFHHNPFEILLHGMHI